MKLAIASDLHLEFGPIVLENTEGAEVLVLAGDICVAHDLFERDYEHSNQSKRIHDFFYNCCNNFPHVVYVLGNHEHYHGDYKYTAAHMKQMLKYLPNLQILDMETWTLHDEITFIGGTLWTDCNGQDPMTMLAVERMMHDFRCIKDASKPTDGTKKFLPQDAANRNRKFLQYIDIVMANNPDGKYVVVGHHGATLKSVDPKYAAAGNINYGFVNDLEDFIAYREKIVLWCHGHTHDPFDYTVGTTRVCANPRGYIGHEPQAETFQLQYIDL